MARRHLAALVAALGMALAVVAPSANAFHAPIGNLPLGRFFYTIDQSYTNVGYLNQPLWAAEQGWKIQGLGAIAEFWNDPNQPGANNRRVLAAFIGGNANADATLGCVDVCTMRFDPNSALWNTTMELRGPEWLDFVGAATHEFGHWLGLSHVSLVDSDEHVADTTGTTSHTYPVSDNGARPTMEGPRQIADAKYFRTIQADDVNGFRAARHPVAANLAANGSFDAASPDWGGSHGMGWLYRRGGAGGSSARYCSGAVHGPCFIEFNGGGSAGSSLFQDIYSWNRNWLQGRSMTPRIRLRSPVFTSSATVVVWAMEAVGGPRIAYQRTCTLPAGQWIELSSTALGCAGQVAFNEPTDSVWMRLEIYNNHTNHNLDVDNVRLEF